ncbi:hypothetical protein DFS34DRAFT_623257 [Phlyctochytrium arcticum]|nr:hypothetical protein DFS34DRAFT_623257 [Phlyctochytrium arcticum]
MAAPKRKRDEDGDGKKARLPHVEAIKRVCQLLQDDITTDTGDVAEKLPPQTTAKHFLELLQLHRQTATHTLSQKRQTQEAKHGMDRVSLDLQNIHYEIWHLKREIAECEEIETEYQRINLIPDEEFDDARAASSALKISQPSPEVSKPPSQTIPEVAQPTPEASQPTSEAAQTTPEAAQPSSEPLNGENKSITIEADAPAVKDTSESSLAHERMLARLNFELTERERLLEEEKTLILTLAAAQEEFENEVADLDRLDKELGDTVQATLGLQAWLGQDVAPITS